MQGIMTKSGVPNFSIDELEQNFKFLLINSHPSLDIVQSLPPGVIEVGGLHLKTAAELSKDITDFVKNSQVIYMELDSRMTEYNFETIKEVVQSFPKLKFLMKMDKSKIGQGKLPKNLYISEELNSNDVLGE